MSRSSKVWDYFNIHEDDNSKAVCTTCKTEISRGGVGKAASTSSLLKHMKYKHSDIYREVFISTKEGQDGQPETSKPSTKIQSSMFRFLGKKKWDINDARARALHYAIGQMIAIDNQPLSVVTDIGKWRMFF